MNDKIKTAIEIAMEKLALLEDLSEAEKEEISNKKKLGPLMAEFYKGILNPEGLWTRMQKETNSLLKSAQSNLLDSLKFGLEPDELKRRNKALIALESLKKEPKTAAIQQSLSNLENLQKRAVSERDQVYNEFKKAVENNPQARSRVIEQAGQKIMLKLSVEDAIIQNPQWKQFMAEFEKNNEKGFEEIIQQLKKYI